MLERLDPRLRTSSRGLQVLVVDDSRAFRALTTSILVEAGYEVRAVADGSQAWSLLQEVAFDVVVSDLQMPHMGGLDLLEKVRASGRLAELPVIVSSSQGEDRGTRSAALAAGASDYVAKDGAAARLQLLASIARWAPGAER